MTTITIETKIAIARDIIANKMSKEDVMSKYSVSERSVYRFKSAFAEQIEEEIKAAAELEKTIKASAKVVNHRTEGYDIAKGKVGGRVRNGRISMVRAVIDELGGFDGDYTKMFKEANLRAVKAGMSEINKSTFYVMLSRYKSYVAHVSNLNK